MTTTTYQIIKKALLKKKAELKASPAAARQFLVDSGLGDLLENTPAHSKGKTASARKTRNK